MDEMWYKLDTIMSIFANMLIFTTEDKVEIWLLFLSS